MSCYPRLLFCPLASRFAGAPWPLAVIIIIQPPLSDPTWKNLFSKLPPHISRELEVLLQNSSRKCLWVGGFRLGFVHHCPRPGGSGLYHYALILYHLTTARGLGSGARSVSESCTPNLNLQYKTRSKPPKLKPPQPETLSR